MIELSLTYWTATLMAITLVLLLLAMAMHFYSRGKWAALVDLCSEEEYRNLQIHWLLTRDWREYRGIRNSQSLAREEEVQELRSQIATLRGETSASERPTQVA
jgi:hypothetical protein